MGWFDEQIKERLQNDDAQFAEAFARMSSVVAGKAVWSSLEGNEQRIGGAIAEMLSYYGIRVEETDEAFPDMNERLEFYMRPHGIMRRPVRLEKGWYKDCIGAMLGSTADGGIVALIPGAAGGYTYMDYEAGRRVKVTKKTASRLSGDAICFYKPFPLKELGIPDLLLYTLRALSAADLIMVSLASLAAALTGMLLPYANDQLFGRVLPGGSVSLLFPIAFFFVGVGVSQTLISITSSLIQARVSTKINLSVQSAAMMRVLAMPAVFFKSYAAGELSSRVEYVGSLCRTLQEAILSVGLSSLFSLIYIGQIFAYAPGLAVPALSVTLASCLITLATALLGAKLSKKAMELSAKQNGMQYALVTGVQKIRLTGAEKRAFGRWAGAYAEIARLRYDPPAFLKFSGVLSSAVSAIGTLAMYYYAVKTQVGVPGYMAFTVAYGMVSGAFSSLFGIVSTIAGIKPALDMALPLLKTVPEVSAGKKIVTRVSGAIELSNVSFRYSESMPPVIENLSLKIRAGQYIAIVGQTGCGKSTILRLLLGFETPGRGAVYYDNRDLATLDLRSLRRHIGVVMQNGKLMQGSIYSNIVVAAPWLTMEDAWEAAVSAGIADDIRAMPMGMHTVISEGAGGISGGQKQRLMIARAVAPKPRIIMFDEATSALDNITQRRVSESLNRLKCTRIVIAHRLSTIKQCDRIIVLDKGRIAEDGSYDELIAQNGYFAGLIARQRLDNNGFVEATTAY